MLVFRKKHLLLSAQTNQYIDTMKKLPLMLLFCMATLQVPAATQNTDKNKVNSTAVFKQEDKAAEIKFETTSHDFGKFSEKNPVVKCTFTFTNLYRK